MKATTFFTKDLAEILSSKKVFFIATFCMLCSLAFAQQGKYDYEYIDFTNHTEEAVPFKVWVESRDILYKGNEWYTAKCLVSVTTKKIIEMEVYDFKTKKTTLMHKMGVVNNPLTLSTEDGFKHVPAGALYFKDEDTKLQLYYTIPDRKLVFFVPGAPSNYKAK